MADFRTDTSAIKVEQTKPMTLSDMLNIGKQTYELSKLKELYPAIIAKEQAQSKTAQTEQQKAERTLEPTVKQAEITTESAGIDLATKKQSAIASGYVAKIYDPMIVAAAKNPNSINKDELVKNITKWGIQQGKEAGVDQETTMRLIQPYIDVAQNNPAQLQDYLKQRHILGLGTESRTGALTPSGIQVNTGSGGYTAATNPFGGTQQGQPIAGTQYTQQVSPQTITVNGVQGTLDAGGNFKPLGGENVTQPLVTPPKQKPEIITGETQVMSAGGVPQLNDQQKQAYEAATIEKARYKDLTENVKEADKTVETALQKLSQAKGSAPGRMVRSAGKWVAGNEDLEILTKSLADLSVRQSKLMGAGTDAANEAVAKTQGNADLTEGGLRSILQRISATNTAWKDYTKASMAYESNRGIYGANVNHEQFKKAWAANYDTNIFILQNIHDSNLSKADKELEAQKLFKGMSDAQMKEFERKARNIHALENGNYK
jgi:hypothetical protein